jgi:hypothetical protein
VLSRFRKSLWSSVVCFWVTPICAFNAATEEADEETDEMELDMVDDGYA